MNLSTLFIFLSFYNNICYILAFAKADILNTDSVLFSKVTICDLKTVDRRPWTV